MASDPDLQKSRPPNKHSNKHSKNVFRICPPHKTCFKTVWCSRALGKLSDSTELPLNAFCLKPPLHCSHTPGAFLECFSEHSSFNRLIQSLGCWQILLPYLGVSENTGYLILGVLIIRILLLIGYYIRVPYFRKLSFASLEEGTVNV